MQMGVMRIREMPGKSVNTRRTVGLPRVDIVILRHRLMKWPARGHPERPLIGFRRKKVIRLLI